MKRRAREGLRVLELAGEGSFLAREEISAEDLAAALRLHREGRPPAARLKTNLGTVVTRVPLGAPAGGAPGTVPLEAVVKETPLPWRRRLLHALGVPSRRRGDFERAGRLRELGVDVPRVLACSLRTPGRNEIVVTEFVAAAPSLRELLWLGGSAADLLAMPRGVASTPRDLIPLVHAALDGEAARRQLLTAAGRWLRRLHELGVWQRDLKPGNVLARREESAEEGRPPAFVLIDIGEVRTLPRPLDAARRARNLGQLLDLPAAFDDWAPAALLEGYLEPAEAPAAERWLAAARAARDARRDARERRSGWRMVDEEHRNVGERP